MRTIDKINFYLISAIARRSGGNWSLAIVCFAFGILFKAECQMPTPVINSPQMPADVKIPNGFTNNPIEFFDDFSWRAFIAMVWPAQSGQRGVPDTSKTVGDIGPRVFETQKAIYEVFHQDGSAPSGWNSYDDKSFNPCQIQENWGDITLGSFSKFGNLGQAGFGDLVGPLIAQNRTYVRFFTTFDKTEFETISGRGWYLRSNLNLVTNLQQASFPDGSVDTKSAWIDMTNARFPERFYTRMAYVQDPSTGETTKKLVGLVGLHIVVKTPSRPQWIWASFEQVDNVPPLEDGMTGVFGKGTSTFNDGNSKNQMPIRNPRKLHDVTNSVVADPYNVVRFTKNPIHPSTLRTDQAYRSALNGTVWKNYQLVMTQWPVPGNSPMNDGGPEHSFPGNGATNCFANTTMETFDQRNVGTGCMACHNVTVSEEHPIDFLWSLFDHAYPPLTNTPPINALLAARATGINASPDQRLIKLRQIIEKANR